MLTLAAAFAVTIISVGAAPPAPPAQRTTLVAGAEGPLPAKYYSWAGASHAPGPSRPVVVHTVGCPDTGRACAADLDGGPHVWMPPDTWPARWTLLHEVGHAFDHTVMTDAARDEFRRLIRDANPWRVSPNSPSEKFAEAYAYCARHQSIKRDPPFGLGTVWFSLGYDYSASVRTQRRVCRLIRRVAVGAVGALFAG